MLSCLMRSAFLLMAFNIVFIRCHILICLSKEYYSDLNCCAHLSAHQMGLFLKFEDLSDSSSGQRSSTSAGSIPIPELCRLHKNVHTPEFNVFLLSYRFTKHLDWVKKSFLD